MTSAAVLDALPLVAFIADARGHLTYVSSGWERFTGNLAADVLADGFASIVHPDDLAGADTAWSAACALGTPYSDERRIRFGDGSYRWVLSQARPLRDSDDAIVSWFGTVTDIQPQRDAVAGAQARAESLERLLEASDDCIKVLDLHGRLVSINTHGEKALSLLGLPATIGVDWLSLWRGGYHLAAVECVQRALAEGRGRFTGMFLADGHETWWDVTITPILDAERRPERLLVVSRDVTEAADAAREIAESHERLRLLALVHPGTTWTALPDGRIDTISGAGSSERVPLEERFNYAWFTTVHPDERAAATERWMAAVASGEPYESEFRVRMRDDSYRWTLARALPQRNDDGSILGWMGVSIDIDDRHRAYERESRIAATLQEAALVRDLPTLDHLYLSADYRPGSSEATIGGDWYDAFALADGRVALVIGDVLGNGLLAAVTMAKIRQAMRAVASVIPTPNAMLDVADRTVRDEARETYATAIAGIFDPVKHEFTFASAGHPGPALRHPDGRIEEFSTSGILLGLRPAGEVETLVISAPPGSALVFFTDGLTEATRDAEVGHRRLHTAMRDDAVRADDNPARAIIDHVLQVASATDDVAVLVAEIGPDRSFDARLATAAEHQRRISG